MVWQRHPAPHTQGSMPASCIPGDGNPPQPPLLHPSLFPMPELRGCMDEGSREAVLAVLVLLLLGAFQNDLAELRAAAVQQKRISKARREILTRSEGKLTGTCNSSLAQTANCF